MVRRNTFTALADRPDISDVLVLRAYQLNIHTYRLFTSGRTVFFTIL